MIKCSDLCNNNCENIIRCKLCEAKIEDNDEVKMDIETLIINYDCCLEGGEKISKATKRRVSILREKLKC